MTGISQVYCMAVPAYNDCARELPLGVMVVCAHMVLCCGPRKSARKFHAYGSENSDEVPCIGERNIM